MPRIKPASVYAAFALAAISLFSGVARAQKTTLQPTGGLTCTTALDLDQVARSEIGARSYYNPYEPASVGCTNVRNDKVGTVQSAQHVAPFIFSFKVAAGAVTNPDISASLNTALQNAAYTALTTDVNLNAPVPLPAQDPASVYKEKQFFLQQLSGTFATNSGTSNNVSFTGGLLSYREHAGTANTATNIFIEGHPLLNNTESFSTTAQIGNVGMNTLLARKAGPGLLQTEFTGSYQMGLGNHGGNYEAATDYSVGPCYAGGAVARNAPGSGNLPQTILGLRAGCDEALPGGFRILSNVEINQIKNRTGFDPGYSTSRTLVLLGEKTFGNSLGIYVASEREGNNQLKGGMTGGDFRAYGGPNKGVEGGARLHLFGGVYLVGAAGRTESPNGGPRTVFTYANLLNNEQPTRGSSPVIRQFLGGSNISSTHHFGKN